MLYKSELYSSFKVIYMKSIIFLLQFCWHSIKGFNTSTNWREKTTFYVNDLKNKFLVAWEDWNFWRHVFKWKKLIAWSCWKMILKEWLKIDIQNIFCVATSINSFWWGFEQLLLFLRKDSIMYVVSCLGSVRTVSNLIVHKCLP